MVGRGETEGFRNASRRARVGSWVLGAGPLWPVMAFALAALVFWTFWANPGQRRGGQLAAAGILAILAVLYELRDRAWRHAGTSLARWREQVQGPAPTSSVGLALQARQPLMQDDYVALLERDQARLEGFSFRSRTVVGGVADDTLEWDCRRCHQRAVTLVIHHPIWDGPFEGAGSGIVDRRVTPYCPRCDAFTIALAWRYGLEPMLPDHFAEALTLGPTTPDLPGIPLRLPWTGVDAIRLHEQLWIRAPFHNLLMHVEKAVAPPPAPKDLPHAFSHPGLQKHGDSVPIGTPCEVCGRQMLDPVHGNYLASSPAATTP